MRNCIDCADTQIMPAVVERFVRRKIDEGLEKEKIIRILKKEIEEGDWSFCQIPEKDIVEEANWCHSWLVWHDKKYKQ